MKGNRIKRLILFAICTEIMSAKLFSQDTVYIPISAHSQLNQLFNSTTVLLSDPNINAITLNVPSRPVGEGEVSRLITAGGEAQVSKSNKSFSIPLSFYIHPFFTLSASVPVIWERSVQYGNTTAKTKGLGDIMVGGRLYYPIGSSNAIAVKSMIKLPTGNKNAKDGQLLAPLGTGSTDIFINGIMEITSIKLLSVYANATCKFNGTATRKITAESSSEKTYKSKQGNIYSFTGLVSYTLPRYRMVNLLLAPSFLKIDNGKTTITGNGIKEMQTNPTYAKIIDVGVGAELKFKVLNRNSYINAMIKNPITKGKGSELTFLLNVNIEI